MAYETQLSLSQIVEDPERLFTEVESAHLLRKSVAWVERQRWAKTGPRFTRIGRTPMYRGRDLLKYIEENITETQQVA